MEEGRVPLLWILGTMDNYLSCDQDTGACNSSARCKAGCFERIGTYGFLEEQELQQV